jgi:hypothetical protein
MKIQLVDDGTLRLIQTANLPRYFLCFMAVATVGSAVVGEFPMRDWKDWTGFGFAFLLPLGLAVWFEDRVWTFDQHRERVTWQRWRLGWSDEGSVRFDQVRRVTIQVRENTDDAPCEPYMYQVALVVPAGELPVTQQFGEQGEAERLARLIRETLGIPVGDF